MSGTLAHAADNWTGAQSNDWNNAANWDLGVPTLMTPVVTIDGGANAPVIDGIAAEAGPYFYMGEADSSDASLTIQNGGTLTFFAAPEVTMANGENSNAVLTVTGVGSSLMAPSPSPVDIGKQGTAVVNILDGGFISFSDAVDGIALGVSPEGFGTLNISNGTLDATSSDLYVGEKGTGALNITNGGWVVGADIVYVADGPGSSGSVLVDGIGSKLETTSQILLGDLGAGTMDVTNGGAVASGAELELGYAAGSTGTLTVDGAGSSVDATGNLTVGGAGTGALSVSNGGDVSADIVYSAVGSGSTATFAIDGLNSNLQSSGAMYVGAYGTGTMDVTNGGSVASAAALELGSAAGSTGTLTVDGATSSVDVDAKLHVGVDGTGVMNISNGAQVNSVTTAIGGGTTGSGIVRVNGTSSVWESTGALNVGTSGAGTLQISNGGTVSTNFTTIGSLNGAVGTVVVTGDMSTYAVGVNAFIGTEGTGSLLVADGAGFSVNDGIGTISVGAQASGYGTINIGAAEGDAAAASGALNASAITFGDGSGSISFNHTDTDYVFAADISSANNSATINHTAGVTTLTGDSSSFTGFTSVAGGDLYVNGALGGPVSVTGGLIGGSGSLLGKVVVDTGGTIAPGDSIGTLNVGNITFETGSIYQVEVDGNGSSDLIKASGSATIHGGTVDVVAAPDYAYNTPYTIVSAATSAGSFDDVVYAGGSIFVSPTLTYGPGEVYLTLEQALSFADVALTPNQKAAAAAAEGLGTGNPIYDEIVVLGSDTEAQQAFDAISGEIYASANSALIDDSRILRDAALERTRLSANGSSTQGLGVWGQGFGAFGTIASDGNAAALSHQAGGVFVGADGLAMGDFNLGVLAGYSKAAFSAPARASSGSATSYHLAAYGDTRFDNVSLRFGGAYSWHDIAISRTPAFGGFTDNLSSSYGAATSQVFGEFAYQMEFADINLEPFANLAWIGHNSDAFAETGGSAALSGTATSSSTTFATAGLRGAREFAIGDMSASLSGMVGWQHAFGATTQNQNLSFDGGTAFTIGGVPVAQDALVVEAGLDIAINPAADLNLDYSGQVGAGVFDHAISAGLGVRF